MPSLETRSKAYEFMSVAGVIFSAFALVALAQFQATVIADDPEMLCPLTLTAAYDREQGYNAFFLAAMLFRRPFEFYPVARSMSDMQTNCPFIQTSNVRSLVSSVD